VASDSGCWRPTSAVPRGSADRAPPWLTHPTEHLLPCLLDRLTDEDPASRVEGRAQRAISVSKFKDGVLRDLRWLFNTQRHLPDEGWSEFPEVEKSVLNFGVRDSAGIFSEGRDLSELERELHETILRFEPRIIRRTLQVQIVRTEGEQSCSAIRIAFPSRSRRISGRSPA
jgi:type VI secretion system protein ImpF